MTISENVDVFFRCKVKDFTGPEDWEGHKLAYRLRVTWDDDPNALVERLEELLEQEDAAKLKALIIGSWAGDDCSKSSDSIIDALVARRDRLAGLAALFLGDITYEENEISWIVQSDVTPLLRAFPRLEVFRVRGGNGLKFSKIRHEELKQLIIETGGLPRSVVREICRSEFPNLEHLELWLGVNNYGWDGGVEDLQPILAGKHFPKLSYLGFRNSEIADEIAPVLVNAPVLQQLEVLDLSNGTLGDVGAQALMHLAKDLPLKELILSHHYMTEDALNLLKKAVKCKVVADDPQEPDEDWRSVVVSE
jgi:hypothetical protein